MSSGINEWKQRGTLHLWRFKPDKRGLKGWHFFADHIGCDNLVELLDLLKQANYPVKRTIKLEKTPHAIAKRPAALNKSYKVLTPDSLRFVRNPETEQDQWSSKMSGQSLEIELGYDRIEELADSIRKVRNGDYDFSIGPTDGEQPQNIWFW